MAIRYKDMTAKIMIKSNSAIVKEYQKNYYKLPWTRDLLVLCKLDDSIISSRLELLLYSEIVIYSEL